MKPPHIETRREGSMNSVEMCGCGKHAAAGLGPDTYWFAPNELWNAVNGSPNGFLCPECFTTAAAEHGLAVGWRADLVGRIEGD
jgi:hypothetical protein